MKGFYIYNLILEVILMNMVDCQVTSEEVYSLLSQRLNLENTCTLLRNELEELKSVVKKQDEKIAALSLSAPRTPETAEDANKNNQDLQDQITVMQHAFQSEKELVRGIQSNLSDLETGFKSSTSELESKLQTELSAEIKTSTSVLELKLQKEIVKGVNSSTSELESKLDQRLTGIKSANSELELKLEKEIETEIKSSTSELESKLQVELAAEIKTFTSKFEANLEKEHLNELKLSISALESKLERQKVAFSAVLTKSIGELVIGARIIYDQIVYQDGNGYNSTDGVFTCPETGVYMFSVVLHGWHGKEEVNTLVARLMVDSEEKSYVVSESQHLEHNDQASNLVILAVDQGQKVWVQNEVHAAIVFRTLSTFSGALLYN